MDLEAIPARQQTPQYRGTGHIESKAGSPSSDRSMDGGWGGTASIPESPIRATRRPPPYSTSNEGAAAARRAKGERAAAAARQQRMGISSARRMAREAREKELEEVRAKSGVHRGVVVVDADGSLRRLFPGDAGYAEAKS